MREHRIEISHDKGIGCGMCVRDCPAYNLGLKDKKAVVRSQSCLMCGHCVAICPKAAVSITGFDEPPIEIEKPVALDPHQLLEAIRTRRSIRQYKEKPVAPEVLAQIIEAGRLTPSGGNAQNVSYIVLQKEIRRYEQIAVRFAKRLLPVVKLMSTTARNAVIDDHFFFKNAPVAIVVVSKDEINASLAASNMELMAEALGLGVLYSGFFARIVNTFPTLRRQLHLTHAKAVTTLVLGYPNVHYRRTAQKDPADMYYL